MSVLGEIALVTLAAFCLVVEIVRRRQAPNEEQRVKLALQAAVRTSIAKAPNGVPVKIFGRARSAGQTLTAPVSKRPCFVYDVHVERRREEFWTSEQHERHACDFIVEDATGKALVRVSDSELRLDKDVSADTSSLDPPNGPAKEYLERVRTGFGRDPVRVSEGVIEEGESVAVLGIGRWERDSSPAPDRSPGYRGRARRFVIQSEPELKLSISDDLESV